MKSVIFVTLLALVGSSLAISLARAGPPVRQPPKAETGGIEFAHIHAELRPKRPAQYVVDIVPHHPEETVEQKNIEVVVAEHHKQPEHHQLELELVQEPRPQHVELNLKQTEQKPQHVNVQIVNEHHKQPEHHQLEFELNQQRPDPRPHHVEFEIKQTEQKPQHVNVELVADHHKKPEHHQVEFELVSDPKPHHVEFEVKQPAVPSQHIELQLVQKPQPFVDHGLQQFVQLSV